MKEKVLILGKGYVATRLAQETGWQVSSARISSYADILKLVAKHKPTVVVNCIGRVGANNVDDCEEIIDECLSANTFVPVWLGEIAFKTGIKLVHISSGCIYHYDYKQQKPLTEKVVPDYYTLFYSRTKIYSEAVLEPLSRRANILIVRIRIPLDMYPHPRNLLNKLLKYKKVIDVPNSVTYIPDFIEALKHLMKKDARGIFNVAAKGGLQYPQLMEVYKRYVPGYTYEVMPLKDLKLDRTNLLLSVSKLERTGFKVRTIKEILPECVQQYVRS